MGEWRPAPGWEGSFEVSSAGEVRSVKTGRIRKGYSNRGYLQVTLNSPERTTTDKVHRLVARAFHGERPFEGAEIRHLDGDSLNNRADNLAWGTRAENLDDLRRLRLEANPPIFCSSCSVELSRRVAAKSTLCPTCQITTRTHKVCTRCHREQPISEFHLRKKGSLARSPKCRTCMNAATLASYHRHAERRREENRRYRELHREELSAKARARRANRKTS